MSVHSVHADAREKSRAILHGGSAKGSLFGESLQTRHFAKLWGQTMSLSPSSQTTLDIEEPTSSVEPIEKSLRQDSRRTPLEDLDSAIHTFSYSAAQLSSCAYVFFERQKESVVVACGPQGHRLNVHPVLPRVVNADKVVWQPLLANDGDEGCAFLLHYEGDVAASMEVTKSRVVVVHSTYSPMASHAGLVAPSTRLVFERSHPEKLRMVMNEIKQNDALIYSPVTEILLGKVARSSPRFIPLSTCPALTSIPLLRRFSTEFHCVSPQTTTLHLTRAVRG